MFILEFVKRSFKIRKGKIFSAFSESRRVLSLELYRHLCSEQFWSFTLWGKHCDWLVITMAGTVETDPFPKDCNCCWSNGYPYVSARVFLPLEMDQSTSAREYLALKKEIRFYNHFVNLLYNVFNSLSKDKILDWSKLNAFADDEIWCNWKFEICFGKGRRHCGKRRKYWLSAFSPFSAVFSKGFSYRVIKSHDCVVKS